MEVVDMLKDHLSHVVEIENSSFSHPWTESDFLDCIEKADRHYFCLIAGEEVLGYCGYWGSFDEAQIFNVAVKEEIRNKGLGKLLLKKLLEFGIEDGRKRFLLEVRQGNRSAIALYKGLGFCEDGIRPNFYDDPKEDALLMSLKIE